MAQWLDVAGDGEAIVKNWAFMLTGAYPEQTMHRLGTSVFFLLFFSGGSAVDLFGILCFIFRLVLSPRYWICSFSSWSGAIHV